MTTANGSLPSQISIVIFDVTGITSDLLRRAFSKLPEYKVVGCPKSIQEAIHILVEEAPDTVIISAFERSASLGAIELLNGMSLIGTHARAVVLSANLTNDETIAYFRAQARGVLSGSSADFATLCKCVDCVHSGQIWANSEQLVCLVQSLAQSKSFRIINANGLPILTPREEEILHLLSEGLTNRDISMLLTVSEHTVKNHLFHIFDKLGVSSRMEAVVYSLNHLKAPAQTATDAYSTPKKSLRGASEALAVNE